MCNEGEGLGSLEAWSAKKTETKLKMYGTKFKFTCALGLRNS